MNDDEARAEYDGPSYKRRPGITVAMTIPGNATGKVELEQNSRIERIKIRTSKKVSTRVQRRRACEVCRLQDVPCEHNNEKVIMSGALQQQPVQETEAVNRRKRKQPGISDVSNERPSKQLKHQRGQRKKDEVAERAATGGALGSNAGMQKLNTRADVEQTRDARAPMGKSAASPQATDTNEEEQASKLSSMARELEEMRASLKKQIKQLTGVRKKKEEQDDELSRLRKVVQDLKRQLDTQEPLIREFKEEGARARAEVRREPATDKDLKFKLDTMVMNLKYISKTSAIDSVSEKSLKAMFGGRGAVADILREETWASLETHDDKQMMILLLVESWMNHWICEDVLLKPFGFMAGMQQSKEEGIQVSIEKAISMLAEGGITIQSSLRDANMCSLRRGLIESQ